MDDAFAGGMKGFLLDENLPAWFPVHAGLPVIHSTQIAVQASDTDLWHYAQSQGLVIVTKDADFRLRALTSSPPPWVVHLRFGNMRRKEFERALERAWPLVEQLLPHHRMISVFSDRVEGMT